MSLVEVFLILCFVAAFACVSTFAVIAWVKKWHRVKWVATILTLGVGIVGVLLFSGQLRFEGEFPFQREPPINEDIPGIYVLAEGSARMLADKGYTNLTAQINLRKDKKFEIQDMPHLWLYGSSYRAGYDSCQGTWKVAKPGRVYDIIATIESYSTNSAYERDPDKGYGTLGFVPLGIAAKTKARPDYALAVPLNHGDEGNIIFVKRTNKSLGR